MDTASAASEGNPEVTAVGGPPSVGVPRIPVQSGARRPPAQVPSVDVPAPGPGPESAVGRSVGMETDRDPVTGVVGADGGDGESGPAPKATTGAGLGPFASAFPPGAASKLGWYVYLLVDPRSGRPFYVGRGRGDRC